MYLSLDQIKGMQECEPDFEQALGFVQRLCDEVLLLRTTWYYLEKRSGYRLTIEDLIDIAEMHKTHCEKHEE